MSAAPKDKLLPTVEGQVKSLRTQLSEVKARTSDLVRDNERLKRQLGDIGQTENTLAQVRQENGRLDGQVLTLQAQVDALRSELRIAESLAEQGKLAMEVARVIRENLQELGL